MKKLSSILGILTMLSTLILADSFLPETKTMNATLFENLYDAISIAGYQDSVMWFYWDKWMESASPNPTTRYEGENECREYRIDYEPIEWASTYSKNSLIGALAVDIDPLGAELYLSNVQFYLLDTNFYRYLKLFSDFVGEESVFGQDIDGDGIWEDGEFSNGSWGDCLNYARLLNNVAFIVDMLWYYPSADTTASYNKLCELAGWAYLS